MPAAPRPQRGRVLLPPAAESQGSVPKQGQWVLWAAELALGSCDLISDLESPL